MSSELRPMGPLDRAEAHLNSAAETNDWAEMRDQVEAALDEIREYRRRRSGDSASLPVQRIEGWVREVTTGGFAFVKHGQPFKDAENAPTYTPATLLIHSQQEGRE